MGLLHIPRVLASCARGYYVRNRAGAAAVDTAAAAAADLSSQKAVIGVGRSNPHLYNARVGMLDNDAFGHMNHAAYLVHAELARWEMSATNGSLETMLSSQSAFLVTGLAVRYRKEIGPLFRKFQIKTFVGGIDKRNIWVYHTFRYPEDESGVGDGGKVLAQILVQAVVTQNRRVLEPRAYLEDICGVHPDLAHQLCESRGDQFMKDKRSRFEELEATLRASATAEDSQSKTL